MKALLAQAKMEVVLHLRRSENMLVSVFIPALALVFFSSVAILPEERRGVEGLLPPVMAVAVMASAMVSLGIATGYERHYKVLKRLGGTPLSRQGLLAAKGASALVLVSGQTILLLAVAAALGRRGEVDVLLLPAALVLGTFTFAAIGLLLAGTLRAESNLAIANALFLGFLLVGGTLIPLSALPESLAAVSGVLPSHLLTLLLESALSGGSRAAGAAAGLALWGTAGAAAGLALWGAVAAATATFTFKWE